MNWKKWRIVMNCKGIFFDLDGTMWDVTESIKKIWNIVVNEFEELRGREITTKEFQNVMGLPMDDIAGKLFPDIPKEVQLKVLDRCCEVENEYLEKNGGILYPKLESTLSYLSEKYVLCIVSNGQAGYIQTFLKAHNMEKYFDDFQNWGDNKVEKGENIKLVMKRNNLEDVVYVGDTKGDANAAKTAGIPFVYAQYGFGNVDVDEYDYKIEKFEDLKKLF